ncbi:MAG: tRNA pseudouridine(55) synthase TruB [Dehalococcoidia bacterium]|nr:tRNA pseudouridine(55) synthase TruB [Dehalococcoidia bacterium]
MSSLAGFLIVDKPRGVTSFSMVALVRRLTGVRRVGHAGTLDPLASGVLPVAVGAATRLIEYLEDGYKTYVADVRFGAGTTTDDAEGELMGTGDAARLHLDDVVTAFAAFVGDIEQTPPAYSAIKLAGKPLYRYARAGIEVRPAARRVHIERIDLLGFADGVATIEVVCGSGTYIRSLAHDTGAALGCPAHLAALRRTHSGGFSLDDARGPAAIEAATSAGRLPELLLAPDRAVERRPAAIFGEQQAQAIASGRDVTIARATAAGLCRAYTSAGAFVGVLAHRTGERWHPEKVFSGDESG